MRIAWRSAFLASGLGGVLACGLTATGAITAADDAGTTSSSGNGSSGSTTSSSSGSTTSSSSGSTPDGGPPIVVPDAGQCIRPGRTRSYEEEIAQDQPANWLRLDDTAGPSAKDLAASGGGATFSTKGITFGVDGATCGGKAIGLDGVDGKVSFGTTRAFPDGQPFSIEVWAFRGSGTSDMNVRRVFSFGAIDGAKPLFTLQTNGDYTILFQRIAVSGVNESYAKGPVFAEGTWKHYVATVGATQMSLYIDGVLSESSPKKNFGTVTAGQLVFGDYSKPASAKWKGVLDEIAIYDRELTATRIAAHYEVGRP